MVDGRRAWLRALAAVALPLLHVSPAEAARPRPAKQHGRHAAAHPAHARLSSHGSHRRHLPPPRVISPLIVIDPGHGGGDPGAVGKAGTLEKAVTLRTALMLKRLLEAKQRYRVLLTRHDDRFVPLGERAALGRMHGAALVISLHADSSPDQRARGASVYVRSGGALGTGLKRVALGGNASAAIARSLTADRPPQPRPGSAWLQHAMIDNLDDDVRMTRAPAREAHLWVLANTDIPGVLVEMGFLSNRRDEALMRKPMHLLLIARSLRDAVDDYFAGLVAAPTSRT